MKTALRKERGGKWGGGVLRRGRIWGPVKFPKEQFTVMDEYTVRVEFEHRGCVCVRRWNAEWFQGALKLPPNFLTGRGLFYSVRKGEKPCICVLSRLLRPLSPSSFSCSKSVFRFQRSLNETPPPPPIYLILFLLADLLKLTGDFHEGGHLFMHLPSQLCQSTRILSWPWDGIQYTSFFPDAFFWSLFCHRRPVNLVKSL